MARALVPAASRLLGTLDLKYHEVVNRREILLDDEANQVLDDLVQTYGGNASEAINEVLKLHSRIEELLDDIESAHAAELQRQKQASEVSFREGAGVDWENIKRRNGL